MSRLAIFSFVFALVWLPHEATGHVVWPLTRDLAAQRITQIDALSQVSQAEFNPAVSFSYDALTRLTSMSDRTGYTSFTYTQSGQLAREDGPWSSNTVSYAYDNNRRRMTMNVSQPSGAAWTQTYQYDQWCRLVALGTPVGSYNYDYWSGQPNVAGLTELVASVTLPGIGWITYNYESRGLLSATEFRQSPNTTISRLSYTYNEGGQRIRETRLNDYVDYGFDSIGRLGTVRGYENGGTSRRHEWFSYTYDAAGNLSYRQYYQLNQYFYVEDRNRLTSASYNGLLTVAGMTGGGATSVNVNGVGASLYPKRSELPSQYFVKRGRF